MLRAPPPRPELVLNNVLPKDLDDPHACSEELTKEPCLLSLRPYATRCPVLDIPGDVGKVWQILVGSDQVDQVDGLVIVHHGNIGVVVVRHGGGGGRRSEGLCGQL